MPGSILESATTEVVPFLVEPPKARRQASVVSRLIKTPRGIVALFLLLLVVGLAVFAGSIAPGDPFDTSAGPALSSPSRDHVFGTDNLGRDVFTGVVHGARTSMTVVLWVVVISSIIGITIGMVSGYRGGLLDDLIMRIAEMFQVVPRFFLALLVVAFFGPGLDKLILLLGLTSWPFLARLVRIETLRLKQREFVESSRAIGASPARIVSRHLLPNLLPPALVVIALFASRVIMIEAGLAFLGLGDPDQISWGFLANNAQQFLRLGWWMSVFPGIAIIVAVLGLNLFSDAVNDALGPRQ